MENNALRAAMLSVHSSPAGDLGEKDTGGMSTYLRELSSQLGKMGWQVDLFTRSTVARAEGNPEELASGVRLVQVKAGPLQPLGKEEITGFLPEFVRGVEDFQQAQGACYHLVFSHYWISGLAGEILAENWQVPHLVMFHTLAAVKDAAGIGSPEPAGRLEAENRLARSAARVLVPTEKEKNQLLFHYDACPETVRVIPCGVNLERFQPGEKQAAREQLGLSRKEQLALYVGRLDPIKGLKGLLQALGRTKSPVSFRLLVVGGGKEEVAEMEQFCRQLQLSCPVTFLGAVKHEQLPCYYSAADLLVVPSYYESFGLAALEAMACGTPVVATDVGELAAVIDPGETGYLVPVDAADELVSCMEQVFTCPERFDPLAVRERVTRYGWPTIARQVRKTCREVMAEPCREIIIRDEKNKIKKIDGGEKRDGT